MNTQSNNERLTRMLRQAEDDTRGSMALAAYITAVLGLCAVLGAIVLVRALARKCGM